MTKRKILDTTSIKKRDTMMSYTNSTSSGQVGGSQYSNAAAVITGQSSVANPATFLWCATARDNSVAYPGNPGNRFTPATRTSSTPYMIGLKESIEIQCNNGVPWQWRRICFTMKGNSIVPSSATTGSVFNNYIENNNGFQRVMNQVPGTVGVNPQFNLYAFLFKGAVGVDWLDPLTASTDNSRLTIKYDKTTSLASGNEDGFIRKYNRWHPMYKTLVYDDDESGGAEVANVLSTLGRAGMGDYYVVDIFRARDGAANSDQLSVRPSSTLYWHEK